MPAIPVREFAMSLLFSVSGYQNVRQFHAPIARALGNDVYSAIFLNQCMFWQGYVESKGRDWFYKTDADWIEELCFSAHDVKRCKGVLKKHGLIETKVKKANGSPTCHYRVTEKALNQWFCQNSPKRIGENRQNEMVKITKTITKNTSEITNREQTESLSRNEKFENSPIQSQTPTSPKVICDEASVGVVVGKSKARKNPHVAGEDGSGSGVAVVKSPSVDAQGVQGVEDVAGVVTRVTDALNQAIDSTFRDSDCQKHIKKCLGNGMTETELMAVVDHVSGWVGNPEKEDYLAPIYIFGSRAGEYARKSKKSNKSKPRIVGKKRQYYLIDPATNPDAVLVDEDEIPVGTDAWDKDFRRIVL